MVCTVLKFFWNLLLNPILNPKCLLSCTPAQPHGVAQCPLPQPHRVSQWPPSKPHWVSHRPLPQPHGVIQWLFAQPHWVSHGLLFESMEVRTSDKVCFVQYSFSVWFVWDRLGGTISNFWDLTVSVSLLFVCCFFQSGTKFKFSIMSLVSHTEV